MAKIYCIVCGNPTFSNALHCSEGCKMITTVRKLDFKSYYKLVEADKKYGLSKIKKRKKEVIEKARRELQWAVKSGTIKKEHCLACGKIKTEAHHVDYKNPLLVYWLCRTHHVMIHKYFSP